MTDLKQLSFMIAEDNAFMRRILKGIVSTMGYTKIKEVGDGKLALDLLTKGFETDVLITDWTMPNLDGIELTRAIRASAGTPNPLMPIILVTDRIEPVDISAARDAGVTEIIGKPVTSDALSSCINSLIEASRSFVTAPSFFGPDRRRRDVPRNDAGRRNT